MGIRIEGTFDDGTQITHEIGEHVDLPTLLTQVKHFVLGAGYIVDPLADLVFLNQNDLEDSAEHLHLENAKLRNKIRKLKKKLANKKVKIDAEFGQQEFLEAAAKFVVQNLDAVTEAQQSQLSKEIEECGCRTDDSDIPCIFHD